MTDDTVFRAVRRLLAVPQRQRDGKRRAFAGSAFYLHLSAEQFGIIFDDVKSQTGAAVVSICRAIRLVKLIEDGGRTLKQTRTITEVRYGKETPPKIYSTRSWTKTSISVAIRRSGPIGLPMAVGSTKNSFEARWRSASGGAILTIAHPAPACRSTG